MMGSLLRVTDNWNAFFDIDSAPSLNSQSYPLLSVALLLTFLPTGQGASKGNVCIFTANTGQHYIVFTWSLTYLLFCFYYSISTRDQVVVFFL